MGEVALILQNVKKNKNDFEKLINMMTPLINKYTRLLYKDEKEDINSELILALWEAVLKMKYYEDDGKCLVYLSNAIKNKFFELYRKSRKQHDNEMEAEYSEQLMVNEVDDIEQIIFEFDIERFLNKCEGKRKLIFKEMLENPSYIEVGKKFHVSRQYANRLRKELYQEIKCMYLKV